MIAQIVWATAQVLTVVIIARALISWIPNLINPRGPIAEFLYTVTEPILGPLRRIIPRMGMMDLTPMIAILLIQFIAGAIVRA
jgi:YggT family protein